MSDAEPKSPCVSICWLDEADICKGCYRSADEITDWPMSSAERKREILRICAQRRDDDSVVKLS